VPDVDERVSAASIGGSRAMTLSSGDENVVELLAQSNDIVVGRVAAVTDDIGDVRRLQVPSVRPAGPAADRGRQSKDDAVANGTPEIHPR
jgi:hypothetical protein